MSENNGYRFKDKEPDAFTRRLAKSTGKIAIGDSRRTEERARSLEMAERAKEKELERLGSKLSLLDMSEGADGMDRVNSFMYDNAANIGKPPMIFTRPSDEPRDSFDVAFGDSSGIADKAVLAMDEDGIVIKDDIQALQKVFPDGFTIIGNQANMNVRASEFDELLGENDAIVLMHTAQEQNPAHQRIDDQVV